MARKMEESLIDLAFLKKRKPGFRCVGGGGVATEDGPVVLLTGLFNGSLPVKTPERFWEYEAFLTSQKAREDLIEGLRNLGHCTLDKVGLLWKEVVSDLVLTDGSWTGQLKSTSPANKKKDLFFKPTLVSSTIYGTLPIFIFMILSICIFIV